MGFLVQGSSRTGGIRGVGLKKYKLAIIGLGYVGLPLAVEFGKIFQTIGFDHDEGKVNSLRKGIDPAGEVTKEAIEESLYLDFELKPEKLKSADVLIVAVPTPVDKAHVPDFGPLISASQTVGGNMKDGAVVVYESTVYPGATEEICIPVLESVSGKLWGKDFNVGYSPERINPGDRERGLSDVVKVVSGDTEETLRLLERLYGLIIKAGIYPVASIKVAEAAKVIENTQRDLNIALMNELAIIFDRAGINTMDVLRAAGTKWNFLPFRPGLVGGHCIGVDPYYLTYKAEMLGYHPQVILAGRRINDGMAEFIANKIIEKLIKEDIYKNEASVIVLGITFKENCSDIRNSKVIDLIQKLQSYRLKVFVHDPIANPLQVSRECGIELSSWDDLPDGVAAVVTAVPHDQYLNGNIDKVLNKIIKNGIFFDIKSAFRFPNNKDINYISL